MLGFPMRILDRYILRTFLVPFFYCMLSFELLYIVFDLFDNMQDLMESGAPITEILQFYAILLPSSVIYIVPISLLLGVLYSLAQFTRHNELTAMRASGISLNRLMWPFLIVGVVASIAVGLVNETLAPWSLYRTDQLISLYRSKGQREVFIERNLPYKNVAAGRIWMIDRFDTRSYEMEGVELIVQGEEGYDVAEISADRAEWKDGVLWFYDMERQNLRRSGLPQGPPQIFSYREMADFDETPQMFLNERKDPEYLSAAEIKHFIDTHSLEPDIVTRLNVDRHYRLAIPWTCLIITMIGVPFGAHTGRKGTLAGIALILALFFSYYILIYLGLGLGKNGYISPELACWTPHVVFFVVAVWMIVRMR